MSRMNDIMQALKDMGFERDNEMAHNVYRSKHCEIRLTSRSMHLIGSGTSVRMDLGAVRLIRQEGELIRIVVRGGHHSALI